MDAELRKQRRLAATKARRNVFTETVHPKSYFELMTDEEREAFFARERKRSTTALKQRKIRNPAHHHQRTIYGSCQTCARLPPVPFRKRRVRNRRRLRFPLPGEEYARNTSIFIRPGYRSRLRARSSPANWPPCWNRRAGTEPFFTGTPKTGRPSAASGNSGDRRETGVWRQGTVWTGDGLETGQAVR